MARASYQHIDNIRIGQKPVCVTLSHKNNTNVTVCLPPVERAFSVVTSNERVRKPKLHLKF